ncbi:hypothetical protein B0H10DRAFT_1938246 [Mycena sp. CBHHK59/15]|nr:hypothetical protein B0H10DRAFT_1938246 [Mycena sp. CBHHK59/15]
MPQPSHGRSALSPGTRHMGSIRAANSTRAAQLLPRTDHAHGPSPESQRRRPTVQAFPRPHGIVFAFLGQGALRQGLRRARLAPSNAVGTMEQSREQVVSQQGGPPSGQAGNAESDASPGHRADHECGGLLDIGALRAACGSTSRSNPRLRVEIARSAGRAPAPQSELLVSPAPFLRSWPRMGGVSRGYS